MLHDRVPASGARALLAVGLLALTVHAAEPPVLPSTLRGASLFKNGLGLVSRDVTAPAGGEWLVTGLPAPANGSFWVQAEQGVDVLQAVAVGTPRSEPAEALSMADLLKANVGRQVELRTPDGWTGGVLKAVPERLGRLGARTPPPEPWYYGRPEPDTSAATAEFVLLETPEGQLALRPSEIKGVRGKSLATSFQRALPGLGLKLSVSRAGHVRLSYLTWGLSWTPSYRLDTAAGEGEATLSLQATVLNDAEPLADTTVSFVSGFPNFLFGRVLDPLARGGDVAAFIGSLRVPDERDEQGRGYMMNSQIYSAPTDRGNSAVGLPYAGAPGEQAEELFFQPREHTTLDLGGRASYPIFTAKIPCRSVYLLDLPDTLDHESRWQPWWYERYDRETRRLIERPAVWRVLRVRNTTATPFTTGPVLVVKGERPLAQDIMLYVSPGGETDIKVTKTPAIGLTANEVETGRKPSDENYIDVISAKGTVKLSNRKDEAVTLVVTKALTGVVDTTTPNGEVTRLAPNPNNDQPRASVRWVLQLAPGASVDVSYAWHWTGRHR